MRQSYLLDPFNVKVLSCAPEKLSRLTPFIHPPTPPCNVKHRYRYIEGDCQNNVVYSIPMRCGKVYIGETSRCLNVRIREHFRAVDKEDQNSHIVQHKAECDGCSAIFEETSVIAREHDDLMRLLTESVSIVSNPGRCVSQQTVVLSYAEQRLLLG